MIGVKTEGDLVIIDLMRRCFDGILSVDQAEKFAQALRAKAAEARLGEPQIRLGQTWGVKFQSFDGGVGYRFVPPEPGAPTVVRVPADTAEKMAGEVEFQAQQAKFKMRFVFQDALGRQQELTDIAAKQRRGWRKQRARFGGN